MTQAAQPDGSIAVATEDPDALFQQAVALARAQRTDEAVGLFVRVASLKPKDPRPAFSLGLLHQGKDPATAERWLREALTRDPEHATARFTLGALLGMQRRDREAAECFRGVLKRAPHHADSHANLATLLTRLGEDDDARYHLHRAVELKPDDAPKRYALAVALHKTHRLDEAAEQFRAVLRLRPDDLDTLYNLGVTLPPLRREAEALECFERILELDPQNVGGTYQLGRLLITQGRAPDAVAILKRAHALEPDHAEALRYLARASTMAGVTAPEETLLRRILAIEPEDGRVRHRLGQIVRDRGETEEAFAHFAAAAADRAVREEALAALRKLAIELGRRAEYMELARKFPSTYQLWLDEHHELDEEDRPAIAARIAGMAVHPRFSVVLPVYNPALEFLDAAIRSVRDQIYPHWELCIADDASTDPAVRALIERHMAEDPRIKAVFRAENGHIAAASNSGLEIATGTHVGFLDHDDLFSEHALYVMAEALNEHPDAELVYSDHDLVDEFGTRHNPYFKGGWDLDLFYVHNYVCHLAVYRLDRVRAVGGFRLGTHGSQDWDLTLRVIEQIEPRHIHRVPFILYHWRAIAGSTAADPNAKPYSTVAALRALRDHFERIGVKAGVEETAAGYRVRRPLPDPAPRVSVIVPTKDRLDFLKPCIEGVLTGTDYPGEVEVLIVDNGSTDPDTLAYMEMLERAGRARVQRAPGPFNYAALNNDAVRLTTGTILCFLNNDTEPLERDWLAEMVVQAVRPEVGAVGAKLYYRDGTVQHTGVVTGLGGIAGHHHLGLTRDDPGYYARARAIHAAAAVTGACLVMRRAVFDAVGGFDAENFHVNFNDVDLCLKINAAGYRVLMNPHAELHHYESASRGIYLTPHKKMLLETEGDRLWAKWGRSLLEDPFYNPNLSLSHPFHLAEEPRVVKPWAPEEGERVWDDLYAVLKRARGGDEIEA